VAVRASASLTSETAFVFVCSLW